MGVSIMDGVYAGTLYFEDNDVMAVHRLVVRDGELAFDVSVTWGDSERWDIDLIATELKDGAFQSPKKRTHNKVREGPSCEFWCQIAEQNSRRIALDGRWIESGEYYDFSGELERITKSELR